jgi:hypothetical protein
MLPQKAEFFALVTRQAAPKGKPVWFAALRVGKNYVSYYFMSVSMNAATERCLPPDLKERMQASGTARAELVLVNMLEGKMFVEFRADSREALEGWLKTEGMQFGFLVPIEWEMNGDKLQIAE